MGRLEGDAEKGKEKRRDWWSDKRPTKLTVIQRQRNKDTQNKGDNRRRWVDALKDIHNTRENVKLD